MTLSRCVLLVAQLYACTFCGSSSLRVAYEDFFLSAMFTVQLAFALISFSVLETKMQWKPYPVILLSESGGGGEKAWVFQNLES